ncbi:MAG: serine/threonine protein kinase [Muribaculaceae bacterium]|nr:serine/threonine protein kinase [Muribaculaceae bacterium]
MIIDSEIRDVPEDKDMESYPPRELIFATKNSLLFRIRRDGRYFIVKQAARSDERASKILRREYELSVGCSHPNIVDVYEYRLNPEGGHEILMEYVDGRSLEAFMSEKSSLRMRKKVFQELLNAVSYLHNRGIIHNDIKPSNILISYTGNHVKLIDLGIADDDAHFDIKTPGFTDGYASPELREKRKPDGRSDIYSLGVIMKELVGKKYSFVWKKCIRNNPEKRYSDIPSLNKSWNRGYLLRLWPSLSIVILISGFGLWYAREDNRNKNYYEIPSIENIRDFKTSLRSETSEAIDSLKECKYPAEMIKILQNHSIRSRLLYEEELRKLPKDAPKGEITSAFYEEAAYFNSEFHRHMKEAEERVYKDFSD